MPAVADDAVRLHAAAAAIREALALQSPAGESPRQRTLDAARSALGPPAFEEAWKAGHAWTLDDAIEHALDSVTNAPVTA